MNNYKTCKKCGAKKFTSEFSQAKENKDRLNSWCKSCHQEYQREFRKNNPEEYKKRQKEFMDKIKPLGGIPVLYKERFQSAQRKYRASEKGTENHRIRQHKYRITTKGKYTQSKGIKNRINNLSGTFSLDQWNSLLQYYCRDGVCPSCGKKEKMTIDHVIPIIKNGTNTIDNIQPLCKLCNCKKHASTIDYRHDNGEFARLLLEDECTRSMA